MSRNIDGNLRQELAFWDNLDLSKFNDDDKMYFSGMLDAMNYLYRFMDNIDRASRNGRQDTIKYGVSVIKVNALEEFFKMFTLEVSSIYKKVQIANEKGVADE